MDPNYQPPGQLPELNTPNTPPEQPNPYGFILDTAHQQPKKMLQPSHTSMISRALVAGGVAVVLIIAAIIVSSLISSGGKENSGQLLTSLAAQQQEIVRVADLGVAGGSDSSTKAFAQTTKLAVLTQQNELAKYLASKSVTVDPAVLAAKKNSNTDTAFKAATASNHFDDVFNTTITAGLSDYAKDVKTSHDSATSTESKTLLAKLYTNTQLLLKSR